MLYAKALLGRGTEVVGESTDFRVQSLPLMKYANFITFNMRAFALYTAVLTDLPWLYPAFELTVLTAVYIYLHYRHEKMSAELYQSIVL